MNLKYLCTKVVILVTLGVVAGCGENLPVSNDGEQLGPAINEAVAYDSVESVEPSTVQNKVLILAATVTGGFSSQEAVSATQLGYTVEVVTDAQWAAKTAADFATYRAIILGDPTCGTVGAINAAVANRNVWGPVVNGNVIIVGTDPVYHTRGPGPLTKNSVQFAASQPNRTGAYIDLSCYYHGVPARTPVAVLDQFGSFTVTGVGCYNTVHIVASHPALTDLTDANLSGWGCSVHEAFDSFPSANFAPLVIARDPSETTRFPGSINFPDGSHGPPYILARGATPVGCGNSIVEPPEECDNGSQNGVPGNVCSSTCRLHWCGDGVLDPGEECDQGALNGSGSCSTSCRSLSVNRPPVALCRPLALVANATCGATGSIDNGSYDPDNNLVGCTQSPAGPYGPGNTTVTLTCTDASGLSASCTAGVTVVDSTPPSITCPADKTAECTAGSATVDPGAASGADNCGTPAVTTRGPASYPLGTTNVSYTATDRSGNTATCSTAVNVVDTLAPSITLHGDAHPTLECAVDSYSEAGASANDQCAGDVSSSITIAGSVNTGAVGSYSLSYTAHDPAGHSSPAVTRDVTVRDTIAPAITCPASTRAECVAGSAVVDPGAASATDACGLASVTPSSAGSYPLGTSSVTFTATDRAGHTSSCNTEVTVSDTMAPSIVLNGNPAPVLECAVDAYVEAGATAVDVCAGDVSSSVTRSGAVNTGAVGGYVLAYSAVDPSGNASGTVVRAVSVRDTLAPSLSLNGANPVSLECGVDTYAEPGATASDACSGDLSSAISIGGSVNANAEGSYAIAYGVADPSGNTAAATRSVTVADTTAPALTLLGAANVTVECGQGSFTDPGATAADACYGDLTGSIVTSGSVDASHPGSYSVNYTVTDGAGLSASQTRTVTVVDTQPPQVTYSAPAPLWPPNHRMETFHLSDCAAIQDACGGSSNIDTAGRITSISSDEVEDAQGQGDGHTTGDIVITGPSTFQLRVEREGASNGRVYSVNFVVSDSGGNQVSGTCHFAVPHDQSGAAAVDDGPSAGYTVTAP